MPTYEYICEACQHAFEKFHSIKADPITLCPDCGQERVRRKIGTGAAILFKGGGFYETDYRSAGYNEAKKNDTGGEPKSDAKSDAKSETKLDAKPDTAAATKSEPAKPEPPKAESKPAEIKAADAKQS